VQQNASWRIPTVAGFPTHCEIGNADLKGVPFRRAAGSSFGSGWHPVEVERRLSEWSGTSRASRKLARHKFETLMGTATRKIPGKGRGSKSEGPKRARSYSATHPELKHGLRRWEAIGTNTGQRHERRPVVNIDSEPWQALGTIGGLGFPFGGGSPAAWRSPRLDGGPGQGARDHLTITARPRRPSERSGGLYPWRLRSFRTLDPLQASN
jgi:hypothetical protein